MVGISIIVWIALFILQWSVIYEYFTIKNKFLPHQWPKYAIVISSGIKAWLPLIGAIIQVFALWGLDMEIAVLVIGIPSGVIHIIFLIDNVRDRIKYG